jgi:hypothetical protein
LQQSLDSGSAAAHRCGVHDEILHAGCRLRLTCPPPLVVPALAAPVTMVGSGAAACIEGRPFCVEGDELPPPLRRPLAYAAAPFTTPGLGVLSLHLAPEHWSRSSTIGGRRYLRRGPGFTARFTVTVPATQPTPAGPVPDAATVRILHGLYLPLRARARG